LGRRRAPALPFLEPFGLAHEGLLLEIRIKDGCLNISGLSVHTAGGHEGEDCLEGTQFRDRGEGMGVVNKWSLTDAMGDRASFKAINIPTYGLDFTLNTYLLPMMYRPRGEVPMREVPLSCSEVSSDMMAAFHSDTHLLETSCLKSTRTGI
jgi:hypothetical protein